MDTVAQRLAEAAHQMVGRFTDIPYPDWEGSTEAQREFWRELARVSQDPEKPKKKK